MTIRITLSVIVLLTLLLTGCGITGTNYIPAIDLGDAGEYWNNGWQEQTAGLYHTLQAFINDYSRNHDYVFGESDCNDMVVEIWDDLSSQGIVSLIVVGNMEASGETFEECNHAWLMVYNGEGAAVALDPSCSGVYRWEDAREHPYLKQYWEGIVYENPDDLWSDFQERW